LKFITFVLDIHQITKITDIIGSPPEDEIENIKSEQAKKYVRQMQHKPRISFAKLYPAANATATDLLEKMLAFDPVKRISVEDALAHPYLAAFHDPDEEPGCKEIFNFDFENYELNKEQFQELIWNEMLQFHPELGTANLSFVPQIQTNLNASTGVTPMMN
jgi:serine/threonine protein kinase